MGEIKQINIKNRTYYFYNDIIDLHEFDRSRNKSWQKKFNGIDIYCLAYEYKKKITECNVVNSVNPLYLRIIDMRGQCMVFNTFWWYICFKKCFKYLEKCLS